jgi:hypothetical protein
MHLPDEHQQQQLLLLQPRQQPHLLIQNNSQKYITPFPLPRLSSNLSLSNDDCLLHFSYYYSSLPNIFVTV